MLADEVVYCTGGWEYTSLNAHAKLAGNGENFEPPLEDSKDTLDGIASG